MIPLHEPVFIGNEKKYLNECISSGYVSSVGKFVSRFEKRVSKYLKVKYANALNSGTSSLHLALKLVGVDEGDEVIVPSITFIAPVNAIKYLNAKPIFLDSDEFYTINKDSILNFIKNNTKTVKKNKKIYTYNIKTNKIIKALIIVHCFGNVAEIIEIKKILKNKNIKIIEDAAESFGSYIKIKSKKIFAGTIGDIGCLSFNGNKIITSGGGGMILTNNKKIFDKSIYLATQSKNDSLRYIHNQVGFNYKMNNIQAAVGLAQLENINKFILKKTNINLFYKNYINNKKFNFYINENPNPDYFFSINWLNILRFDNKKIKPQIIIDNLKKHNIESRHVWLPNHLQKPYINNQKFKIKNANRLVSSSVCLPSSYSLNKSKIMKIANILNKL
tara:strand:+ start:5443 stop:6609 length:1167 start_codon:yes stop_codon:yes gene_type:complete